MTGERFLDLLMGRLGRTSPDVRATCLLEAQFAQETQLENNPFLPSFTKTLATDLVLTIGARALAVPSTFIREVEDAHALKVISSAGAVVPLIKGAFDELASHWGEEATSEVPANYAIGNREFLIFPLPEQALAVHLRYHARQTLITDAAVENSWLLYASDLLLATTGYLMASKHLRDDEKVREFQVDIAAATTRLITTETALEEANRSRTMG